MIVRPSSEHTIASISMPPPFNACQGAEGNLAVAPERLDQRPFRGQRHARLLVVNRRDPSTEPQRSSARVSTATMPWPGAGTQRSTGMAAEIRASRSKAPQSGAREHERVELADVQLPQARIHVAANRCEGGARHSASQLRDPPDAAGPDRPAARRRGCDDRRQASPLRGAPAGKTSASRGSSRGSVAAIVRPSGMSEGRSLALWTARSISPTQQRVLEILDEEPLAANLAERRVLQAVAGRLDDDELDGVPERLEA